MRDFGGDSIADLIYLTGVYLHLLIGILAPPGVTPVTARDEGTLTQTTTLHDLGDVTDDHFPDVVLIDPAQHRLMIFD
jgi:hypothetical protein